MANADLILYNGVVHTMTQPPVVSAVAVKGGKILAVGSDEDMLSLAGPDGEKVDLQGACMVPGFNDSHCHLRLTGANAVRLDLRGVQNRAEIVERGKAYLQTHPLPEGEWVVGCGFDHNIFPDGQLPDGATAAAISETIPVLLDRVCGHVGAANPLALSLAGYDETTVIPGGVLDRGEDGRLNGILREAALDQIKSCMQKPSVEAVMDQLKAVMKEFNRLGLTSAQSDDLEGCGMDLLLEAFRRLEAQGEATVRVFEEVQAARIPVLEDFLSRGLRTGDGTDFFKIGNIKLLTDGSLGARTAYLREDYSDDPGNRGVPVYTQDALDEVVLAAHQAGMQVACHAIGDGAVEQCVLAVERARVVEPKDLRHRIVHCQFADDVLFDRMAKAGMGADIQPPFTVSDRPLTPSRIGPARETGGYAWKSMLRHGVAVAAGSDSPVESPDPLWGIYCAVTRQDETGNDPWHPEECLTVEQAVRLYTVAGAYASFEEDRKGSISPGMLADFAVLSRDIFTIPPKELLETHVLRTIVGGRTVYQKND